MTLQSCLDDTWEMKVGTRDEPGADADVGDGCAEAKSRQHRHREIVHLGLGDATPEDRHRGPIGRSWTASPAFDARTGRRAYSQPLARNRMKSTTSMITIDASVSGYPPTHFSSGMCSKFMP